MTLALIQHIGSWWDGLSLAKQLFYGIGLVSGMVSIVLGVLALLGVDSHDAADALDAAGTGDLGGGLLSIKPLTGFFLGFGWGGGMAMESGLAVVPAIGVAFLSGGAVMAVVVLMVRSIYGMKSDGTVRVQDAVGAIGTVYVTVPGRKAAGGQVVVNFSGRQETLAALAGGDLPIPGGEKVKVVALVDRRTVLVEKL